MNSYSKSAFELDIKRSLSLPQKALSSKYFYDARGDELFQQIMAMPTYYLPSAELEILTRQTADIVAQYSYDTFNIVELGAGDGTKTIHFLKNLVDLNKTVSYYPLDISPNILDINKSNITAAVPNIEVNPIPGDYFDTLATIPQDLPKIILFLGSNLGNFEGEGAVDFLSSVKSHMTEHDLLVVGVDLMKDPRTILAAYNDPEGLTRAFNLNLLTRINHELNANFDIDDFDHYPFYNPLNGRCYSFIISLEDQEVEIGGDTFQFDRGEAIHTEISEKYNLDKIYHLKYSIGFKNVLHLTDTNNLFSINVFS